jgi:hypothetical protein
VQGRCSLLSAASGGLPSYAELWKGCAEVPCQTQYRTTGDLSYLRGFFDMSVVALWNELEDCLLPVFAGYRSRISELPIEVKADHTLLTEADVAVQRIIIAFGGAQPFQRFLYREFVGASKRAGR